MFTYFARQGFELQTLLFGSGRGVLSQNVRLTFPPCSSIHVASDIYTEENNIIRQKWYYSNMYIFQEKLWKAIFEHN